MVCNASVSVANCPVVCPFAGPRLTGVERLDRVWRLAGGRAVAAAR